MKSPNLQPALSPIQREILVGGMLGDLSIYRAKLTHNARLYVQQGAVHTEYLNHLYSVLQNLCSSGPRPRTRPRGPRPGPKLSVSLDKPSLRPNPSAADYGVACLAEGSALARGPVLGPRGTVGLLRPGEAIQHTRLLDLTPVVCLVQLLS